MVAKKEVFEKDDFCHTQVLLCFEQPLPDQVSLISSGGLIDDLPIFVSRIGQLPMTSLLSSKSSMAIRMISTGKPRLPKDSSEVGKVPDKPFSGKFQVRVSPEIHRAVALAAGIEGKSLNVWVAETLEREAKKQLTDPFPESH